MPHRMLGGIEVACDRRGSRGVFFLSELSPSPMAGFFMGRAQSALDGKGIRTVCCWAVFKIEAVRGRGDGRPQVSSWWSARHAGAQSGGRADERPAFLPRFNRIRSTVSRRCDSMHTHGAVSGALPRADRSGARSYSTEAGIAKARESGKKFGRPSALSGRSGRLPNAMPPARPWPIWRANMRSAR